jgi:hypothetical protein
MSNPPPLPDPFEFVKKLWAPMGIPVPGFAQGMVFPTTNLPELEKRITELKSVEGWLTLNLEMVRTMIQGLEAQKATVSAFQSMHAQAAATFTAAQEAAQDAAASFGAATAQAGAAPGAKPPRRPRKKKVD